MNRYVNITGILIAFLSLHAKAQYYPDKSFPVLFREVQLSDIFPDSKTFADAVPIRDAQSIKKSYQKQKVKKNFDLKDFVLKNFRLPSPKTYDTTFNKDSLISHIDELWVQLKRPPVVKDSGSLLSLPFPYIVPGGRFNEMYYWDSYFTMLGLQISGRTEEVKFMTDNFAYLIDRFGFVPNGTRSYYLTRSQPPFFSLMVDLVAKKDSNEAYKHYLPQLLKEYSFWMNGSEKLTSENNSFRRVVRMEDHVILNRYWDDSNTPRPESFREDFTLGKQKDKSDLYRHIRAACESGWDFSSRWFQDGGSLSSIHTTDIVPVDLNCLLYHLEYTIMKSYEHSGNLIQARIYSSKAQSRKASIIKYFWDDSLDFFTDFDFKAGKSTGVKTMAGIYPLYFNIASADQAQRISHTLQKNFLFEGGLSTTTKVTNQQWDAPNGWAPLQYIGYESMMRYKKDTLADTIAYRWMRTIEYTYNNTGKLLEKYNVVHPASPGGGGEYPTQDGFGWTNGIYLYLKGKIKEEK